MRVLYIYIYIYILMNVILISIYNRQCTIAIYNTTILLYGDI